MLPASPFPLPAFDERDIARSTSGAHTLDAGRRYQREARARVIAIGDKGRRIEGEVRGTAPYPYRQSIIAEPMRYSGGGTRFTSMCTCPVGGQCKHVAAVLFQLLADEGGAPARLTPELTRWLGEFERAVKRGGVADVGTPPKAKGSQHRLLYRIDLGFGGIEQRTPLVHPITVKLDQHGRIEGKPKGYDPRTIVGRAPAQYLDAADVAILSQLAAMRRVDYYGGHELGGDAGGDLFDRIVATGRAHWRSIDTPPLSAAGSRSAKPGWRLLDEGAQRFELTLGTGDSSIVSAGDAQPVILALSPPRWLDPATGETGILDAGLAPAIAAVLLRAPPVPTHAVAPLAAQLAKMGLGAKHLPRAVDAAEPLDVAPSAVAVVMLSAIDEVAVIPQNARSRWQDTLTTELAVVRLMFDYAGKRVGAASGKGPFTRVISGRLVSVARRPAQEAAFVERLRAAGLTAVAKLPGLRPAPDQSLDFAVGSRSEPRDLVPFLLDTRPALEAEGWRIEVADDFPLTLAVPDDAEWRLDIGDAPPARGSPSVDESGIDWFDATLGIEVDGERVDVLPAIVQMLRLLPPDRDPGDVAGGEPAGYATILQGDGRTLALPYAKLRPILSALWRLFAQGEVAAADGKPVRLSRWQAGELTGMAQEAGAKVAVVAPERVALLAGALADAATAEPTRTPLSFHATLRPYQQSGLDRMQLLGRAGFGLVLADDMGLGKTVQALAHLAVEHALGRLDSPALVIAPTSVLPNWAAEAASFALALSVHVWHGPDRAATPDALSDCNVVVTSYPLLARDAALLGARAWSIVIADEAQMIRNPATAAAQALFALTRRQTIALTGTPIENSLGDIWSIAHATNPGLLGTAKDFVRHYRTPIEKHGDPAARARLARRLRPFLLRRTKDEVASELPPKTEIAEMVALEGAQAALYEAVRLAMHARVQDAIATKGLARSRIVVLDALLKLRQTCCDPRLVKHADAAAPPTAKRRAATRNVTTTAPASAKLARLHELLDTLRAEGRAVLLFSQFTSMLDLIRADLDAAGRTYAWLTGDTQDRVAPVRRFQAGEVDLFLISLKAGGTGLNLTRADAIILYDPWWNPAVEAQAIDRAHRIGQTKPVFVHRLIAKNTIEEKMLALQARKRELAAALWEGGADANALDALTPEDVTNLFT